MFGDSVPPVTVPAEFARRAANSEAAVFLRRPYTNPETGQLASVDSRRRLIAA